VVSMTPRKDLRRKNEHRTNSKDWDCCSSLAENDFDAFQTSQWD